MDIKAAMELQRLGDLKASNEARPDLKLLRLHYKHVAAAVKEIKNDEDIIKLTEKARLEGQPPSIVTRIYHGLTTAPERRTTVRTYPDGHYDVQCDPLDSPTLVRF